MTFAGSNGDAFAALSPVFGAAARRFGVPENLLRAYAMGESAGDPSAVGPPTRHGWRAQGLMQMAPGTYAEMAKAHGLGADPMNPTDNVTAGAAYLRQLTDEFGKYGSDVVTLAWNAGPGYAREYLAGRRAMPDQTRALSARIGRNLGAGRAGGDPGATPLPSAATAAATAAAPITPPAASPVGLAGGATPPAGLLGGMDDGSGAAAGPAGLLGDQDALDGALAALAPLAGTTTRPIAPAQVLAALAGGVDQGREAGRQRRRDRLIGDVQLAGLLDKAGSGARARALVEDYAKRLEAGGQPELAAAVRADPSVMGTIAGQQAKTAYPDPLKPGDRFRTAGDAVIDVTTGKPIYDGGGDKAEKERFAKEHTLRAGFDNLQPIKNYRETLPIFQSMVDAMGRDSQAADLNLVYGLAKVMDPASVVRESETEMVVKTGSPAERLMGQFNAVVGGARLTPAQRADLMVEARSRLSGHKSLYDELATNYTDIARNYGLDPASVVTRIPEPDISASGAPRSTGAAAPALMGTSSRPASTSSSSPTTNSAQRAVLNGRVITARDGRWVYEDDGSPVP